MVEEKKLSKLEYEELQLIQRFQRLVNKMIDYALIRLTDYMSNLAGRKVTEEEALRVLEQNPDVLKPQLLDEAIAADGKAAMFINIGMRMAGAILKQDKQWAIELQQRGEEILIAAIARIRPDIYKLLEDKPNLTGFLTRYILNKMGIR